MSNEKYSVYKKLQTARLMLQATPLTKSGRNKFAGYEYFELGDFIPAIQKICGEVGLCGMISYTADNAFLSLQDTDGEGCIVFSSPMSSAALKGCHEVQNLGAVQSYLRRYLWIAAFEIVEQDALDALTGKDTITLVKKELPKPFVAPKAAPATSSWKIGVEMVPSQDSLPEDWLKAVDGATVLALEMAISSDNVMQIFKGNKSLFDEVKKVDPAFFKTLMGKFTEVKNKFAEAA